MKWSDFEVGTQAPVGHNSELTAHKTARTIGCEIGKTIDQAIVSLGSRYAQQEFARKQVTRVQSQVRTVVAELTATREHVLRHRNANRPI